MSVKSLFIIALISASGAAVFGQTEARPRIRDLGVQVGVLSPGPLNAITDVAGVKVGQTTLIRGDKIRTGVTAILPHGGNLYKERVPGAVFLGNAYGKLVGSTQVNEMGEIETPILLTATDSVPRVADAVITYTFNLKGNENVLSVNPLVGETNDGWLSDIRSRPITPEDVFAAINNAAAGPVEEGVVGAGTGTVAFSWKGGIGTSSRRLPASLGGYTVGVLVQTNFGGNLDDCRRPCRQGTGEGLSGDCVGEERCRGIFGAADAGWLLHDCGSDRCSARPPQSEPVGVARDDGPGSGGIERKQRKRGLCHRIFELSGRANRSWRAAISA